MKFNDTNIPGIVLIEPQVFEDSRGFFMETYQAKEFKQAGIQTNFVQDNHSRSRQGILRGLHYQLKHPQGKLVRAIKGEIFDVAVDIRRSSPTFGCWTGKILSAENKMILWVPEGFAHGFFVMSEWAEVIYKTTDYYAPRWERTLRWDDPAIGVQWPVPAGKNPQLSEKDRKGKLLVDCEVFD